MIKEKLEILCSENNIRRKIIEWRRNKIQKKKKQFNLKSFSQWLNYSVFLNYSIYNEQILCFCYFKVKYILLYNIKNL